MRTIDADSLADAVRSLAIDTHRALKDPDGHVTELCILLARVTRLRAHLDDQGGGELLRWLDAVRSRIIAAMQAASASRTLTRPAPTSSLVWCDAPPRPT